MGFALPRVHPSAAALSPEPVAPVGAGCSGFPHLCDVSQSLLCFPPLASHTALLSIPALCSSLEPLAACVEQTGLCWGAAHGGGNRWAGSPWAGTPVHPTLLSARTQMISDPQRGPGSGRSSSCLEKQGRALQPGWPWLGAPSVPSHKLRGEQAALGGSFNPWVPGDLQTQPTALRQCQSPAQQSPIMLL